MAEVDNRHIDPNYAMQSLLLNMRGGKTVACYAAMLGQLHAYNEELHRFGCPKTEELRLTEKINKLEQQIFDFRERQMHKIRGL